MKKRGFTLIELLVVIAIIAILAAILFPVMTNAKKKAQQSTCASNLKQLMMGIRSYCDDFNGGMPLCTYIIGTPEACDWSGCHNAAGGTWNLQDATILRYIRNTKVFECPSNSAYRNKCPYAMNWKIASLRYYRKHCILETITAGRSSRVVVLIEELKPDDSYFMWGNEYQDFSIIHLAGGNNAYADGHVAYKSQAYMRGQKKLANQNSMDSCLYVPGT